MARRTFIIEQAEEFSNIPFDIPSEPGRPAQRCERYVAQSQRLTTPSCV